MRNPWLYKRFAEGSFTLRDMYEHLENVMKLGPMNKVLEMMPGLAMTDSRGRGEQNTYQLKCYMTIMDSMNEAELDAPNVKKFFTPSRLARISNGSGRAMWEVQDLLKSYNKFDDMVRKMGKMNFKQLTKDPSLLSTHTGQEQMSKLARAMDPQMLRRMGGVSGLQAMMKQLSEYESSGKSEKKTGKSR